MRLLKGDLFGMLLHGDGVQKDGNCSLILARHITGDVLG